LLHHFRGIDAPGSSPLVQQSNSVVFRTTEVFVLRWTPGCINTEHDPEILSDAVVDGVKIWQIRRSELWRNAMILKPRRTTFRIDLMLRQRVRIVDRLRGKYTFVYKH